MWTRIIAAVFAVTVSAPELYSQYKLDNEVSSMYISGTSTMHDWIVTVEEIEGSLDAEVKGDTLMAVRKMKISIPVESLESGKSAMDENMHKALKAEKYPEVSFLMTDHSISAGKVNVEGKLTIAGVTKTVKTTLSYTKVDEHLKFHGNFKLKMSDYKVQAPEFLFGSFKTGDTVELKFYFMFCDKK